MSRVQLNPSQVLPTKSDTTATEKNLPQAPSTEKTPPPSLPKDE